MATECPECAHSRGTIDTLEKQRHANREELCAARDARAVAEVALEDEKQDLAAVALTALAQRETITRLEGELKAEKRAQGKLDRIEEHIRELKKWVLAQNVTIDQSDDPEIVKRFSFRKAQTLIKIMREIKPEETPNAPDKKGS